jgi:hypothetical protein
LPCSKGANVKVNKVPGWTEYVAHKKELALSCHWAWKQAGRPNSGQVFECRRQSRSDYHYAVKQVKKNEDRMRSERMAQAITANNHKNLWKEVNKLKGRKKTLPVVVDGVKGEAQIANIFASKYKELYNSVPCDQIELGVINEKVCSKLHCLTSQNVNSSQFTVNEFKSALNQISCGKSDGQIGLFSDHIVHGTDKLFKYIIKLFNAMLIHAMSPKGMLSSIMLPIVKNKRVQSNNSDNFRAICLQSVFCKLLDLLILGREELSLLTSELQFGFKPKHSAALATSVLLQTVDYYIDNGGLVYGMALDATKAFDRVEYCRLFALLLERGMNPLYIRLIVEMYTSQKMCVKYNNCNSEWFCPKNGVKQGGVLSPTLFAVYIDGMLKELEASKVGCHVGNKFCGVIGYADDVLLLSPTQGAMRKMISICEEFAEKFMIKFNGSKCQSVVFDRTVSDIKPEFYVNKQLVGCVDELVYLGYLIKGDRSDPLVQPIITDFNKKFNAFIGDLDCLSSDVKGSLFQQYCTSMYGILFCQMYHPDMDKMRVSWRKAMRRMFRLPNRTHCNLLPIITDILPFDVQVDLRFLKHMLTGLRHKNSTVSFLFNMCYACDMSTMAKNFRAVCRRYNIKPQSVKKNSIGCLRNLVRNCYYATELERDKQNGTQIRELIFIRDNLCSEFNLSRQEICEIVEHLATS